MKRNKTQNQSIICISLSNKECALLQNISDGKLTALRPVDGLWFLARVSKHRVSDY